MGEFKGYVVSDGEHHIYIPKCEVGELTNKYEFEDALKKEKEIF